MRISFVVPAYNEEAFIAATLRGIRAEVDRVGVDAEILVIDNRCTDGTAQIARSFPGVRVIEEPRKGLVPAREAGWRAATGELVANIDADTVPCPGWLDLVLAEFAGDPELVALSGPYVYTGVSLTSRLVTWWFYRSAMASYATSRFVLRTGSMLQGGNCVVRRRALQQIGGYTPGFEFWGEDTDLACRLHKLGGVKFTLKLRAWSSGRRLVAEGTIRTGMRYSMNFLWATFARRPYHAAWRDIRPTDQRPTQRGEVRDAALRTQDGPA